MISVITPVYNAINFIDDTIKVVLGQDMEDFEWIMVEDGSNDGTRERLKEYIRSEEYDRRVRIIFADDNRFGAAGARNIGLDEARGRYIAYLDADDVWSSDKLSVQLKHMEETVAQPAAEQTVFISHGDCEEDVNYLADLIREKLGCTDIHTNYVDPVIGAHSGPGTLALFFMADKR